MAYELAYLQEVQAVRVPEGKNKIKRLATELDCSPLALEYSTLRL